jgi:hypothetical protein
MAEAAWHEYRLELPRPTVAGDRLRTTVGLSGEWEEELPVGAVAITKRRWSVDRELVVMEFLPMGEEC